MDVEALGNVALGEHIGQGQRSCRAFPTPLLSLLLPSTSELWLSLFLLISPEAPPYPSLSGASLTLIRLDGRSPNSVFLFSTLLAYFHVAPRKINVNSLLLSLSLVMAALTSLSDFSPAAPCSPALSNPDSSRLRNSRPLLLRRSNSRIPLMRTPVSGSPGGCS